MNLGLLWTDKCFFLVLAVLIGCVVKGLQKQPLRLAIAHVFSKPVAVSSAIILVFFLSAGILDSIHFKPNYRSALDNILAPLGDVYEKTYSEPLALTLYSPEVVVKNNQAEMVRPRLKYIQSTLQNSQQKHAFIQVTALKSVLIGLAFVLCLWLVLGYFCFQSFSLTAARVSGFLTLLVCVVLILFSYYISRDLHVFGTGKIGQDLLYATVKSIRTGLMIGVLTTLFMMPLALLLGITAGYFGGFIDDVIQYVYTTLSSIPGVLLITASVLSMQTYITNHPNQFTTLEENADARLLALCFILGVTSWTSLCRLLRAEALKLKEIDYVLAAKALGSSSFKIICKHFLPNVMHIVIITVVLDFSFLVLAEAVLSYVGVGVSPLTISWGNMINAARLELAREPVVWWPMISAFVLMFTLVLASNLFADAVEDAFNPRHHE